MAETALQPWGPQVPRNSLDLASVGSRHGAYNSGLVLRPEAGLRAAGCPKLLESRWVLTATWESAMPPVSLRTSLTLSQHCPEEGKARHMVPKCVPAVLQLALPKQNTVLGAFEWHTGIKALADLITGKGLVCPVCRWSPSHRSCTRGEAGRW